MTELAKRALRAAMREDQDGVRRSFAAISADGRAAAFALTAWCDWTIQAQMKMQGLEMPAAGPMPGLAQPGWLDLDTGRVVLDADEMPPVARWAGRLIAARAAADWDQFTALVRSLPDDGQERAQYAYALLSGCAEMVSLAYSRDGGS